jgi:hypothetical protein
MAIKKEEITTWPSGSVTRPSSEMRLLVTAAGSLWDECPALGYSILSCINNELTHLLMELTIFPAASAAVGTIIL